MGWLHATPEKREEPRCAGFDEEDPFFVMPELGVADYIAKLWIECGKCKSGGMGYTSLDWVDVHAYSQFQPLDKFEAESILLMSRSYCSGLSMKDPNAKAPYQREIEEWEWEARSRSIERSIQESENTIKKAGR